MATHHDVCVRNEGTVFLFTPVTEAAKTWIDENVDLEDWQWIGGGFAVEHRYAADLANGMHNDGLVII